MLWRDSRVVLGVDCIFVELLLKLGAIKVSQKNRAQQDVIKSYSNLPNISFLITYLIFSTAAFSSL